MVNTGLSSRNITFLVEKIVICIVPQNKLFNRDYLIDA